MEEKKKKQYVSDNAQLMAEWHPTKNNILSPTQVASKSGKKVWWKCNYGHEWQAQVYYRTTKQLIVLFVPRKNEKAPSRFLVKPARSFFLI